MACETHTDENGQVVAIVCGSSWGVGVYDTGTEEFGVLYGFPPRNLDPHDFTPDFESCSPAEVKAWREAKQACKCGQP